MLAPEPIAMRHLLDYAGAAVFAISGALAAGRKSLDLLGVIVIALMTSTGGGTIRDLLLDRHPVFWIAEPAYLVVVIVTALLTVPVVRFRQPPVGALQIADAFGLAFFAISAAELVEARHEPAIIVVMMATISSVFGGVLRDIMCAEIPLILRKGNIYATAVIAGTMLYVALESFGIERWIAEVAGMVAIASLRLAAIVWGLSLPVFSLPDRR
jgi:uncharacterized membrane protein YeiH